MTRGRKPQPTALRLIKGNPGKRPLPENEPRPAPAAPEMPDWLEGEAAAEWERVVPQLEALGLLAQIHRAVLVTYCTAWADYVELYQDVTETGWTVPTADGGRKRNPNAASLRDAYERLRSAASEFGMTPSALVRLATPGDGTVMDPLDELEQRRRALERKRRRNQA